MLYDFFQSLAKQSFETNVRHTLKEELRDYPSVHLPDLRFQRMAGKGSILLHTPMLYALGFIGLFTVGGLSGLLLAARPKMCRFTIPISSSRTFILLW